ncbi:Hint and/or PT-HINT domain containing protein [Asbolus verrucosus]|uniref:Hint and/or PT-HINT domain containing protein n=1 Tax=Asbolus verrucosus TaxID=1661398 RepID=A0A482W5C9_ASBVE|nr:Hint and/or PT-HINT domain containing protein [Asbolus verrucosus]
MVFESSQAGKYGGCFSGDSTVLTSTGQRRKLSEVQVGERILAEDPSTKEMVFSEVLLFLHYDPYQKREFLQITLSKGQVLTVTPNHLVVSGKLTDSRTVYAKKLKIGDTLRVSDSNNRLKEDEIVQVKPVLRTGVFAPLTTVGTLVVNDVLASCYATVDDQSLAHWAFSPIRLAFNVRESFYRLWTIISKPMVGWSDVSAKAAPAKPQVGVFWYAKVLYATADYLLPSHLHE